MKVKKEKLFGKGVCGSISRKFNLSKEQVEGILREHAQAGADPRLGRFSAVADGKVAAEKAEF